MLVIFKKIGGSNTFLSPKLRQGPGLQCYHRSHTCQVGPKWQGRALCHDPPSTFQFYPPDICVCHRHFFLGIMSYFSNYFCLCCSADHQIKTATRASNSCASTAMQNLIPPNSLEPDSGYVRSSGLGPGPTNNPDPTLTTITKNRARASATDTWPWTIQVALREWLAWNAARVPHKIKGKVWHILVHQAIELKRRRRSLASSKDELLRQ